MSETPEKTRQRYADYDQEHYLKLDKGTKIFNVLASTVVIPCVMQDWKMAAAGAAVSVAVSTFMGMRFANQARETRESYYSPRTINYKRAEEGRNITV